MNDESSETVDLQSLPLMENTSELLRKIHPLAVHMMEAFREKFQYFNLKGGGSSGDNDLALADTLVKAWEHIEYCLEQAPTIRYYGKRNKVLDLVERCPLVYATHSQTDVHRVDCYLQLMFYSHEKIRECDNDVIVVEHFKTLCDNLTRHVEVVKDICEYLKSVISMNGYVDPSPELWKLFSCSKEYIMNLNNRVYMEITSIKRKYLTWLKSLNIAPKYTKVSVPVVISFENWNEPSIIWTSHVDDFKTKFDVGVTNIVDLCYWFIQYFGSIGKKNLLSMLSCFGLEIINDYKNRATELQQLWLEFCRNRKEKSEQLCFADEKIAKLTMLRNKMSPNGKFVRETRWLKKRLLSMVQKLLKLENEAINSNDDSLQFLQQSQSENTASEVIEDVVYIKLSLDRISIAIEQSKKPAIQQPAENPEGPSIACSEVEQTMHNAIDNISAEELETNIPEQVSNDEDDEFHPIDEFFSATGGITNEDFHLEFNEESTDYLKDAYGFVLDELKYKITPRKKMMDNREKIARTQKGDSSSEEEDSITTDAPDKGENEVNRYRDLGDIVTNDFQQELQSAFKRFKTSKEEAIGEFELVSISAEFEDEIDETNEALYSK